MGFYQFPLFSFSLLPSYIFLPRFRGKDCLLRYTSKMNGGKRNIANLACNNQIIRTFFSISHLKLLADLPSILFYRGKNTVCQHINMETFHAVRFCNSLHRFLYTEDLSSVFQQHFTDSGCQSSTFLLSFTLSPPVFVINFFQFIIFSPVSQSLFLRKKIPVLIEIIPKLRYNK